jgi:hypothetical protein
MSIELEILKRIIMEAEGDEIDTTEGAEDAELATDKTEKASEKDTPKPGTFEDDPMEFILKKYVSLNDILEEMMTPSFKEYVEAIFIVAPKPTTFKILLHNGQYFFLTYLEEAYQATANGKNYYLYEIGEKERCMFAISRMLRYGSPLKTKGPEGAEQGTREGEDTGDDTTPESDSEPIDTTAGAEDLSENYEFIKSLIINEAKSDDRALLKDIMSYISNNSGANITGIKSDNGGPHFRVNAKTEQELSDLIWDALEELGISTRNVDVEIIEPGEFEYGGRSGTFSTHVVTLKKAAGDYPAGAQAHVVRNVKAGSNISGKSLTPTNLGLAGKEYKNGNAIIQQASSKIATLPDKDVSKLLLSMLKDFELGTAKKEITDLGEASGYNKTIKFSEGTKKLMSKMTPEDINAIGKDFGEILGAIVLGNVVKMTKEDVVSFPKGNEPLVDFVIAGYGISSKYKQGAAASLTNIIKKTNPKNLTTPGERTLYKLLTNSFSFSPSSESHVFLADQANAPGVKDLLGKIGKSTRIKKGEVVGIENISDYILNNVLVGYKKFPTAKSDPKADALVQKSLGKFFQTAESGPKYPIDWSKLSTTGEQYGIITSPMAYAAGKALTANAAYVKALKSIISKIEVKQLYMDINIKGNSATFNLKGFSDPSAEFYFTPGNVSVYNPNNGTMAFKMK